MTVTFSAAGGTPPYQGNVNGVPAAASGETGAFFECALGGLPEGAQPLAVTVTDSAAQLAFGVRSLGFALDYAALAAS